MEKAHNTNGPVLTEGILSVNSFGFKARKRSRFSVDNVIEQVNRGLTVVHFRASGAYEFKTFDTYGSEEAAAELVEVLRRLVSDNAVFVLFAHDSASKSLTNFAKSIAALGFPSLANLQNRQAYLAHNFSGAFVEQVNDISISVQLQIPDNIGHRTEYFPKPHYDFEPSVDRYIAHAAGEVDGVKSTNSKEALDANYAKGFRLFELDIIETSDGKLVAAHDWKMWARFTDYSGALPASHEEFVKHKIYGKYTTLDFDGINEWFANHPDAILITDKINDPAEFAAKFVDKSRLIMELFSLLSIEEAQQSGISAMISQDPLNKIKGDKVSYLKINNIEHVAISRRIIASKTKLLLALRDAGIKVYVYNVNFDPGKDEAYVFEHEIGLVYGMYADKWVFDETPKKP